MRISYFLLLIVIAISCNQKPVDTLKKVLNEEQLNSQYFVVNLNADTTLISKDGCIIKIPKGAIESDSSLVKIEFKEALTVTDMVLGGMTTQSNGQSLSSGGMVYFNAAKGYNLTIKKSIQILVPSNSYNRDMNVYNGQKDPSGKINWVDPLPIPKDSISDKIDEGERIFKANCSNCHKIDQDFTGPALYGVTDRRTKKWLYDFTRHGTLLGSEWIPDSIRENTTFPSDTYAACIIQKFGSRMTNFPMFTDDALDKVYGYIKSESDKRPDLRYLIKPTCCDSCEAYNNAIYKYYSAINKYQPDYQFFDLGRTIPIVSNDSPDINVSNQPTPIINAPYSKITPRSARGVYYSINISTTGWFNLDCLIKNYSALLPSELFVRIQGNFKIDLNVVLIIPSVKAFIEGGKLNGSEEYGFDEQDGRLPLPQNVRSYILAFGESDNKLIFGKAVFNTQIEQTITVPIEETTKEKMMSEIKDLKLDDVNADIKKLEPLKVKIEDQNILKEAEKLRPKNCDCGNEADSTKKK